jgi:hypothetical protein
MPLECDDSILDDINKLKEVFSDLVDHNIQNSLVRRDCMEMKVQFNSVIMTSVCVKPQL